MKPTTISVDVAKCVFEIAVSNRAGRVSQRHRLSRPKFLELFAQLEPATVLMEACGSAHHWGRELQRLGHQVVLLPPHAVRPYVLGNKTDRCDAKALLEAFRNEAIHPVPLKSVSQQLICALHRLRSAWLAARTARINTIRGLLREFGFTIPVGARHVVPTTQALLDDAESALAHALRPALAEACEEIRDLEARIQLVDRQLGDIARQTPVVARLLSIPGVGCLSATAILASIGDIQRFASSRHFASYLGLTPRERSSGLRRRLGAISKRGDGYLRMLLTHGARAVLVSAHNMKQPDRLRAWALKLEHSRGHNKATIALANKIARIAWAVWKKEVSYQVTAAA